MKIKNIIVIAQLDNNKFHQVFLSERKSNLIMNLLHNEEGIIQLNEDSLDGMVVIKDPNSGGVKSGKHKTK